MKIYDSSEWSPISSSRNLPAIIDVRINPKVNSVMNYLAKGVRRDRKKAEVILEVSTPKN